MANRESPTYEAPKERSDDTSPRDGPLLLRFGPVAVQQLQEHARSPGYRDQVDATQLKLAEMALKLLGRQDHGGYGIVEDPEGNYYISLFPEDIGRRLTAEEAGQQGLPELEFTTAEGQKAEDNNQPEVYPLTEPAVATEPLAVTTIPVGDVLGTELRVATTAEAGRPAPLSIAAALESGYKAESGVPSTNAERVTAEKAQELENTLATELRDLYERFHGTFRMGIDSIAGQIPQLEQSLLMLRSAWTSDGARYAMDSLVALGQTIDRVGQSYEDAAREMEAFKKSHQTDDTVTEFLNQAKTALEERSLGTLEKMRQATAEVRRLWGQENRIDVVSGLRFTDALENVSVNQLRNDNQAVFDGILGAEHYEIHGSR